MSSEAASLNLISFILCSMSLRGGLETWRSGFGRDIFFIYQRAHACGLFASTSFRFLQKKTRSTLKKLASL